MFKCLLKMVDLDAFLPIAQNIIVYRVIPP